MLLVPNNAMEVLRALIVNALLEQFRWAAFV